MKRQHCSSEEDLVYTRPDASLLKLTFLRRLYDMINEQSLGYDTVRKDGANIF